MTFACGFAKSLYSAACGLKVEDEGRVRRYNNYPRGMKVRLSPPTTENISVVSCRPQGPVLGMEKWSTISMVERWSAAPSQLSCERGEECENRNGVRNAPDLCAEFRSFSKPLLIHPMLGAEFST